MLRSISKGLVGSVLLAGLLAACGSARAVSRTQYGGTLALQGDREKAMEDARSQMNSHCGTNNYTIVSEGETPIGQDTVTNNREDTYANRDGSVTQEGGQATSTRTATEWRVTYQCNNAPQGAPPQGGYAPPPGGAPPPPPAPGY